ncbi:MAG TPA: NAD(P)-dependent oxidoreductase [Terriglobales bacterium]|jgi:phosphoglycerate dehydrogenase-like enzyme|nr:NAD(P)-dependent oxidoreductase [Terriglobales bacterium]
MDTFRVGISNDFLDSNGQLVFPDIGLARFDQVDGLTHDFMSEYRGEYLPEQLRPYDVVISLKPRVTAASLTGIERLCAVGRCGVGYDNVDLVACTEHDVAVFITPAAVVRPVAESIVLFVLALSHNLVSKDRGVRQGRWAESTRLLGRQPADRVVGTIGLGNIASDAINLLRPFGVKKFLAFDPYVKLERAKELNVEQVSLDTLLASSDYVLVNCALTPETRGLIGERELALMKTDAVIINTARGPIIDQKALIAALSAGKLGGAGLDVFEQEPLDPASPLTSLDNVILTSHSIAWTNELFRDMGAADCEGALAVMRGEVPKSVVNKEVLDRPGFKQKLARYGSSFNAKQS